MSDDAKDEPTELGKVAETLSLRARARHWRRIADVVKANAAKADAEIARLTAVNAALQARVEVTEGVLRELVEALDAEAKANMSMNNATENFSYAAPEIRAFDRAMVRAHNAMKAARAAMGANK
jgi:hypothetical protein